MRLRQAFSALGLERGDRIGVWSQQPAGRDADAICSRKKRMILVTINPPIA